MRFSRVTSNLKQVGKVDSAGANTNSTRLQNRSGAGFLLLNAALKPLYVNPQAAEILSYPERPTKTKDFADKLASKICKMVTNGGPSGRVSDCKELLSGSRHYVCRFFEVWLPGSSSNCSNESSLALLLERSPEAAEDILKICHGYNLTRREGEAVRLVVQGLTNKQIAARMGISPNTVKAFLRLAMMKMGVSSRSGIMRKFMHLGT